MDQPLSRVEAVVTAVNNEFVELQIIGSYETFQWPRAMLQGNPCPAIGEKIILELKNLSATSIQKHESKNDPIEQRKLLESLIN